MLGETLAGIANRLLSLWPGLGFKADIFGLTGIFPVPFQVPQPVLDALHRQ